MKKFFYLASIAALALSSCAKNDTTDVVLNPINRGGMAISASLSTDTRSYLDRNESGALVPVWSTGDAFSAYGDGEASVGNVLFSLDPNDHGKWRGTFQSKENNHLLLDGENVVFLYPFNSLYKMTPTWTGDALNPESVVGMEIKQEQQYQAGSFAAAVAPAIGFLDLETIDGTAEDKATMAEVDMEALADYVAVSIQGTEDIESVSLRLKDITSGKYFKINGEAELLSYTLGAETHYFLAYPDETNNTYYTLVENTDPNSLTTIKVGRQDAVACHEPNTYVFAIPGGIAGLGNAIEAEVLVNKDGLRSSFRYSGPAINGGTGWMREWTAPGSVAKADDDNLNEMTNGVFWLNEKITDGDGARMPFLYNPNNDFIIRNELDWLIYFNEYANPAMASELNSAYGRDAYVCGPEEYTPGVVNFNFAKANIGKVATELISEDRVYLHNDKDYKGNAERYTKYVDDYGINGMPCIDNYDGIAEGDDTGVAYNSEFRGHNATLLNVGKIQSANGIFGMLDANANISDINFDGVVNVYNDGVVLSSNTDAGTIAEIGVSNAQANAVIGTTTKVADYEALVLEEVSGLNYIINDMTLDEGLDVKNWDVVYNVQKSVFESLDTVVDEHNTVSTPSVIADYTADYAKLAEKVAVYRAMDNTTAVSVILADRSMWTGSWAKTAEVDSNGVYVLENAEQLAYSYGAQANAALDIDVDANYDNIEISWPNEVEYNVLDGVNNTIYGLTMKTYIAGRGIESNDGYYLDFRTKFIANGSTNTKYNANYHLGTDALAPFKFNKVSNLDIEGLSFAIHTSNKSTDLQRVPKYIAGLSKSVTEITNVNITGMEVNAYEGAETLNFDAYYDDIVPRVGWFASVASNIRVSGSSAEVTEYNVLGLAALVSEVEVIGIDANFTNCSVTDPASLPAIDDFAEFNPARGDYMLGGTMVALVVNKNNNSYGIEFNNSGTPKFLYQFTDNAGSASGIAVYYNNLQEYSITAAGVVEK